MNDTAASVEMLKTIVIDPDFESVCPPLTKDEFSLLEQNILSDGKVTTPLVVWNNILIDGHHRRQIILKHPEISFSIKEVDFDDRYVAEAWICKNQIGKRNLTPEQEALLFATQTGFAAKPTPGNRLRARIYAKDKIAIDFRDETEGCGFLLDVDGSRSDYHINCINTAMRMFRKLTKEQYRESLEFGAGKCYSAAFSFLSKL